jgi:hypothetical protein
MKKNSGILFLILVPLLLGGFVFAQGELEVNYPEISGFSPETTHTSLPDYIIYIFNFSIWVSGIIAFIAILRAGIEYVTSMGNPTKRTAARKKVLSAMLGLAVLFGSYLILTTINPELVHIKTPEMVHFDVGKIIENKIIPPEDIVYYKIPIGGLVDEILDEERLKEIKNTITEAKKESLLLAETSNELALLSLECSCSTCSSNCKDSCGNGYCSGNPCSSAKKKEITDKIDDIQNILEEGGNSENLIYWQAIVEDQIESFRKIFDGLNDAKLKVETCQNSLSERGKNQTLLAFNALDEYQKYLKEGYDIDEFKSENPFSDYIFSSSPLYQVTFYCAESPELIDYVPLEEEMSDTGIEEDFEYEAVLGEEIRIGEAVDNAIELTQSILNELNNIKNSLEKERTNAEKLIENSNPDNCNISGCEAECSWVEKTCTRPCNEKEEEEMILPWWLYDFFNINLIPEAFAQEEKMCEYDCSYCDKTSCFGNTCPGDSPKKEAVNTANENIQDSHFSMEESVDLIFNYINEKEIEYQLKISVIREVLEQDQYRLANCYNSAEIQKKLDLGQKVLWKTLYSCSDVGYIGFEGAEECYGSLPGQLDNFFCCIEEYN